MFKNILLLFHILSFHVIHVIFLTDSTGARLIRFIQQNEIFDKRLYKTRHRSDGW